MTDTLHRAVPAEVELASPASSSHHHTGSGGRRKKSSSSSKHRSSSSSTSSASATKGILKNGSGGRQQQQQQVESLEELVEHERPLPPGSGGGSSSSRHRSGSHGHRHRSHSGSGSKEDRGHYGSSGRRKSSSSSKRHSSREEEDFGGGEEEDEEAEVEHRRRRHQQSSDSEKGNGRRGHRHHRSKRAEEERQDQDEEVQTRHSSKKHSSGSSGKKHHSTSSDVGSERRRHRHRHHQQHQKEQRDEEDEEAVIYDRPKVPAVRYENGHVSTESRKEDKKSNAGVDDQKSCHHQQQLYENFEYEEDRHQVEEDENGDDYEEEQVLYDVPRSNKKVSSSAEPEEEAPDAIYVNDAFGGSNGGNTSSSSDSLQEYDVPRTTAPPHQKSLSELIPEEYDIPKIRDSLSTIEEEHQEYDIPRGVNGSQHMPDDSLASPAKAKAIIATYSSPKIHKNNSPSSSGENSRGSSYFEKGGSSNGGHADDSRSSSSGYRSSSSPSIQSSEELYVNESTVASFDADQDFSSGRGAATSVRDIAIETTLEKQDSSSKKRGKKEDENRNGGYRNGERLKREREQQEREKAREKEREKAEEIEREIRRRRKEDNIKFQKAISPSQEQATGVAKNQQYLGSRKEKVGDNDEDNHIYKASKVVKQVDKEEEREQNSSRNGTYNRRGYNKKDFVDNRNKNDLPNRLPNFGTSSNLPQFEVPSDDFVAIGEIAGDCIELKTPPTLSGAPSPPPPALAPPPPAPPPLYFTEAKAKPAPIEVPEAKEEAGVPEEAPMGTTASRLTASSGGPRKSSSSSSYAFGVDFTPIREAQTRFGEVSRPFSSPPPPPAPAPAFEEPCRRENSPKEVENVQPASTLEGKKKQTMKDRSVDVYNETVRQRKAASKNEKKASYKTVFKSFGDREDDSVPKPRKEEAPREERQRKNKEDRRISEREGIRETTPPPQPPLPVQGQSSDVVTGQEESEDMPSVRQLRSRFESDLASSQGGGGGGTGRASSPPNPKFVEKDSPIVVEGKKKNNQKKALSHRKDFGGGGLMVMSSLTRRSAVTVGRSLKGYFKEADKKNKAEKGNASREEEREDSPKRSNRVKDSRKIFDSADMSAEKSAFTSPRSKAPPSPRPQKIYEEERPPLRKVPLQVLSGEELPPLVDSEGRWSPLAFVARLYALQKLDKDEVGKNSADAARLEGVLERLPQGKKRPTLWHSWKKIFAVADAGVLITYADETKTVALETVELFGGKVALEEDGEMVMLRVVDRRDHSISLRCPGGRDEGQKWRDALMLHVRQDFSKTFVVPSPVPPNHLSLFTSTLVVDFGGASIRAGIATKIPSLPQVFFPAVMAEERGNEEAKYFGLDCFADEVRTRSRLSHPMVPTGQMDRHSVDQTALQGMMEKVFKDLALDPQHYEVQLSVPRALSDRAKQAVASMLFDEFGVRSVNMAHQTVFAFHSYNARSGVMVDLGERMDVVPIVDGYKVQAGVSRSPVGGSHLRSKLRHYLQGRNYSLNSFTDDYVTRLAVERLSYMSKNFDKELDAYAADPKSVDDCIEVAPVDADTSESGVDVRKVELGSERFEACEGLFKPELWGLDQAGVHVLVHKAIRECGVDARREVTRSIFLAGGLTLIPGLRERLEAEVTRLTTVSPRVHASPYRYHAAYLGAAAHALTDAFADTKVTREEWLASDSRLDRYWTM